MDMSEGLDEDYRLPKDVHLDVPHPLWDNIDQIDDDIWNMLGNQTPIRDSQDFDFDVLSIKGLEQCEESSQNKRQRMLQFSSDGNDPSMGNEQINSTTITSKVGEDVPLIGVGLSENLQWTPQLNSCFPDVPHPLWGNIDQIDDDIWNMLGNQTPIRDSQDFDVLSIKDNANKGLEQCEESSQNKRQRMLQFSSGGNDASMGNEQINFTTVNSKVGEDVPLIGVGLSENLRWTPQLNSCFSDGRCVFNDEGLDHSSKEWLADCLNETEMYYSTDDMSSSRNDHVASYDQVGFSVKEFPNTANELETEVVEEAIGCTTLGIFKGKKSYIKSPTKLTSSVAYPFTLIKPCGVHGDVTLKDINQRINAPQTSLPKLKKGEEPSLSCPTSAFSGKPVVVKTKIRTEGGMGSITILRTKG